MAKKLTADDWDRIQKEAPSRYYIQKVEEGKVRVTFDSEIVFVERGDEDSLGNIWQNDWTKTEANVFIDGEPKIYSMGARNWSFVRDFIKVCRANDITPEDIPGSIFDVTKTDVFEQEIVYVGRVGEDKDKPNSEIKIDEDIMRDVLDTIKDLKINSPELLDGGIKKPDFLKAIFIRGKVKTTDTEKLLPELETKKVLKVEDDRVTVF